MVRLKSLNSFIILIKVYVEEFELRPKIRIVLFPASRPTLTFSPRPLSFYRHKQEFFKSSFLKSLQVEYIKVEVKVVLLHYINRLNLLTSDAVLCFE